MAKLILNLRGLMAGYSSSMRLNNRFTDDDPSRSHIEGLIRCALGLPRDEPSPQWLTEVGIEVQNQNPDAEKFQDFQTVRDGITYDGKSGRAIVTRRQYLIDADHQLIVTGDDEPIAWIRQALQYPKFQLYLGRRSCVPSEPIVATET